MAPVDEIRELIDIDEVQDTITKQRGTLYKFRPQDADGFEYFVWRMARFYTLEDRSMPTTAHSELTDWLNENNVDSDAINNPLSDSIARWLEDTVDENTAELFSDDEKAVIDFINQVIEEILDNLGLDSNAAARAWSNKL